MGKFIWIIVNFLKINLRKYYLEIFIVGGYKWLVFDFYFWYLCMVWIRKYYRVDILLRFCYMFVVVGGCYYFLKVIMWIICWFIWMLWILYSFFMVGVDLYILFW